MPSWHPPDTDSGSVQDDESIIKVHNDAKQALAGYGHLASGLLAVVNDSAEGAIAFTDKFKTALK